MTTLDEANDALTIVQQTYDRVFGVSDDLLQRLAGILVSDEEDAATEFRNLLWAHYSGGTVSARVTTEVFECLEREDEVPDNWL